MVQRVASSRARACGLAVAHIIAVIWLASELSYRAGFADGSAVHRLNHWLAAKASNTHPTSPELQAVITGWEKAVAAGQWQEAEPVEPLCRGAWWDLIDPGSAAEADPEPPLRWAV
ncbi:MAG: hypothetical protein EA413_02475 [Cyanobium sp. PLM2.Bin73]|jgi:hypothetical protein|nr:MAG: hypothetical protein EA413_02475 [Cyanobium sp. PLM2.Bin73]